MFLATMCQKRFQIIPLHFIGRKIEYRFAAYLEIAEAIQVIPLLLVREKTSVLFNPLQESFYQFSDTEDVARLSALCYTPDMFRKQLSSLGIGHLLYVPNVGSSSCFGVPVCGFADLLFSQFGCSWHDLFQLNTVMGQN